MEPQKLLNKVLRRFNSLLFFSSEEKEARLKLIQSATPEGLADLLNIFEQAFARQNKYLEAICENDPDFAKNFYVMVEKGVEGQKTRKKLRDVKKSIRQK